MTAERVQFDDCPTTGNFSVVYQIGLAGGGAVPHVAGAYCKEYQRGRPNHRRVPYNVGGPQCSQIVCGTTWKRVASPPATVATTGGAVIGCANETIYTGAGDTGVADVLLWQADWQAGNYMTSPIPTTTAAGVRGAETPSFSVSTAGIQAQGCARATASMPAGLSQGSLVWFDTNGRAIYYSGGQRMYDGTNNPTIAFTPAGTSKSFVARWTGSTFTGGNSDTAEASSSFDGTMGAGGSTVAVGYSSSNLSIDGVIKGVMLDPSPTRCPAP